MNSEIIIYTDGACSGNPGPGGWASVIIFAGKCKELWGSAADTTNNRMELTAAIKALQELTRPCKVKLHSDSSYVVSGFNEGWIDNWRRKDWKNSAGKKVANQELWLQLYELQARHQVEFIKVKGHADSAFNNRCDELAVEATKSLADGEVDDLYQNFAARDIVEYDLQEKDLRELDQISQQIYRQAIVEKKSFAAEDKQAEGYAETKQPDYDTATNKAKDEPNIKRESGVRTAQLIGDEQLIERVLSSETVFQGRIFSVKKEIVELPDKKTADRELINHSGGACILAVDDQNRIYLVRQFRIPYREIIWEVPAGKIDKGEDAESCARRELLEECGLKARSWQSLAEIYPSPGYTSEIISVYLARDLLKSQADLDEGEFLTVKRFALNEVKKMIAVGEIKDAKTQIAVLKYLSFFA